MIYAKIVNGGLIASNVPVDSSWTAFNVPDITWLSVSNGEIITLSQSEWWNTVGVYQALQNLPQTCENFIYQWYPDYKQRTDALHMGQYYVFYPNLVQTISYTVSSIYSSTNPAQSYTNVFNSLTASYTNVSTSTIQDALNIACRVYALDNVLAQYQQIKSSSSFASFTVVWLPGG